MLIWSYAEGICLNPSGTANADGGIASCEKFDFCIVISISTTRVVGCVPATVVAGAGAGAGGAGCVAVCRRNAPSNELPSAEPTTPSLPDSLAAVCPAVSVATWVATEVPVLVAPGVVPAVVWAPPERRRPSATLP